MPAAWRRPLLLFVLALAVRGVAAAVFGIGGPLVEDERGYVLLARSLAAGDGFALPLPEPLDQIAAPRTAFRAPLLPLLLAPLALLGAGPSAMRLVVLVCGALGAPLLDAALRTGGRPRTGLLAGLVYAAWPPAVYLSLRALSEAPSMALLLGAVAALYGKRDRAAGALAALAVLARPAALLPAALLMLAVRGRSRILHFALLFVAVLAPWLMRNTVLHGRPLLTTNSGVTLVGGNCAAAAQQAAAGKWVPPEVVYSLDDDEDAPDLGMWGWSALGEAESDARFRGKALRWFREQPSAAFDLVRHKLARLFEPDPRSAKGDARLKRILGLLTLVPVLLLLLPGLVAVAKDPGAFSPFLSLLVGTVATTLIFYGDTRMRTAADPALLVIAAAGVLYLAPRFSVRFSGRSSGRSSGRFSGRSEANRGAAGSGSMGAHGDGTAPN